MAALREGERLWTPSPDVIATSNLERYRHWLAQTYNPAFQFKDYAELWRWSVTNIEAFWESLFSYFDIRTSQRWSTPLEARVMPGARWFPNARLNYAENVLAKATPHQPALLYCDETHDIHMLSWDALRDAVARAAHVLHSLGVRRGDRVIAYLPNIPEAVIALLATASLGAVWSSCSPDFGVRGVLDRFGQITPKVLIAVDGYTYGGKWHVRRETLGELVTGLPSLQGVLVVGDGDLPRLPNAQSWTMALAEVSDTSLNFEQVPFDHPLWILYSSGTTGLPKPIMHGHGGILLEHCKATSLHNDLRASDRFFWYTSTGWMMWNYLVGGLLSGASIILYNGSPTYPAPDALFRLAEASGISYFGTSAAFIAACIKAGIRPRERYDLSRLRALGSTGSPLSLDGFAWVYENIHPNIALESMSGGTDLCTAFIGGVRIQPIYAGELQGASLGAKVEAFDEDGQAQIDQVGELVITQPMPSMPIGFWGDDDGSRYRASYFEMYPGIWRHGDWIKINARGGGVIYGRSDSTINRQGIRIGTAELYRVVESFPEIIDSLVIDLELLERPSRLLLFVVLRDEHSLDDALKARICATLREDVSPRHLPDDIFPIDAVPYTLSGKKMEVPIRKILLGIDAEQAAKREAMRNPEALEFFIRLGQTLTLPSAAPKTDQ
jgi:acetoacetyl-CoA synthetase